MGRHWTPTGVLAGVGGELKPTLAGTNLTVADGAAWVDGHFAELLGTQVLTVTANGLAVVRFDPAANSAELVYRDGVSTPTQSPTGVYEMPVAQIIGSALADRRPLIGPAGSLAGAQLSMSAPIPLTGAATPIGWDIEKWDTHGFHTTAANSRLTLPAGTAGLHTVSCNLNVAANAVGNARTMLLYLNGANYPGAVWKVPPNAASPAWGFGGFEMALNDGDSLQIYVSHDAGVSLNVGPGYFSIRKVAELPTAPTPGLLTRDQEAEAKPGPDEEAQPK